MKISAKSKYSIASMIILAQNYENKRNITISTLSERLEISQAYLEQIFIHLKRLNCIKSFKGANGGYQLNVSPNSITVYDILKVTEPALFEKTGNPVADSGIEFILQTCIFHKIDKSMESVLKAVTLADLLAEQNNDGYMLYI